MNPVQTKKLIAFALSLAVVLLVGLNGAQSLSRARRTAPDETAQILTNEKHKYSLLYPTGYDVQCPNEQAAVIFVGSLLNVEQPRAYIEVQQAAGRTAEQVADGLAAEFAVDFDIKRSSVMIDGEKAVVLDNVPGQDTNRLVIVVHNDRLYKLMFVLVGKEYGEAYTQMEDLYTTIINSFKFLSVSVVLDERQVAERDETVVSQGNSPEVQLESEELAENPFAALLGPIQAPSDLSVRPCSPVRAKRRCSVSTRAGRCWAA